MSKHVVSFELSVSSVENALKELERYSKRFMVASELFCQKLAALGVRTIDAYYSAAPGDADKAHTTSYEKVEQDDSHVVFRISLRGKDMLFVEFGSGVFYNENLHGSPHPKGVELGMTIGDYPGLGQGQYDSWFYRDEGGEWHITNGQQAACTIPTAMNEMRQNILNAAQEAWRQAG